MAREADGYSGDFQRSLDRLKSDRHAILDEIAKVIVGQEGVLRLLLAAIMARGHCLLMGVPGLAKTAMVKALGQTNGWNDWKAITTTFRKLSRGFRNAKMQDGACAWRAHWDGTGM